VRFFLRSNAGWSCAGLKTLAARMEIHDRSGRIVADFLAKNKMSGRFTIPACPIIPSMRWRSGRMSGFGSMITFETGSLKNANKMLKKVRGVLAGRIAGWGLRL